MAKDIPCVLRLHDAIGEEAPAVFDSPHSGLGIPDDFGCLPGKRALHGSGVDADGNAASIAPGKARPSSIAPSIVFKGDDPFLILGAPGGAYITMGILQVILNVIDFAMPISNAVAAARFSATGNAIEVSNRIPRLVTDELEADGYEIARQHFSYGFGGVHAILIKDGRWIGAADPGRDGMALEV